MVEKAKGYACIAVRFWFEWAESSHTTTTTYKNNKELLIPV